MSALELALIALGFLFLFGFTSQATQSLLAPAPLWNLMWFLSFATSAAFGRGFIFDDRALYLLAGVAASFNIGCFCGSAPSKATAAEVDTSARIPLKLTLLCLAVSAGGLVSVSRDLGTSILSVNSLGSLLSLGQQNAAAIFRGEAALGGLSKLAFSVMQVGFALAGAQCRLSRSKGVGIVLIGLTGVAFMWSTITTQRSYLLVPIVWWVGGYIAATCWTGAKVVAPRVLFRGLVLVSALVVLVVWLRAVRTGGASATLDDSAFSASLPWLAGYLPAFSVWHMNGAVVTEGEVPGFFGGITGLIGTRETGQSGGNQYIGANSFSNAPTMMRDVFAVEGAPAAVLIVILLGALANVCYRRALIGRPGAAAAYAGMVALILWAPNAWFFSYGGRMLAWLLLIAAGLVAGRRIQRAATGGVRGAVRVRRSDGRSYTTRT